MKLTCNHLHSIELRCALAPSLTELAPQLSALCELG